MFKKDKEQVAVTEPETPVESEFPKQGSNGSGGGAGYTVEARFDHTGQSKIINGVALGPAWQELQFPEGPIGVPKGRICFGYLPHTRLLSYSSAQALRWWFVANVEATEVCGALCVDTRLVKHNCTYSYSETPIAAVDVNENGE